MTEPWEAGVKTPEGPGLKSPGHQGVRWALLMLRPAGGPERRGAHSLQSGRAPQMGSSRSQGG